MALTKGFKNLISVIAVCAIVGGGGFYTHKHNYFGMLDEKPKAEVEEAVAAAAPKLAEPKEAPAETIQLPVTEEQPVEVVTPKQKKKRQRAEVEQAAEPAPAPAPSNNSAIDKLKGLNSL